MREVFDHDEDFKVFHLYGYGRHPSRSYDGGRYGYQVVLASMTAIQAHARGINMVTAIVEGSNANSFNCLDAVATEIGWKYNKPKFLNSKVDSNGVIHHFYKVTLTKTAASQSEEMEAS